MADSMGITGSGLTADRLWMDVIATNLANVNTLETPQGGPYRREEVILTPQPSGGAQSFGAALTSALGLGTGTPTQATAGQGVQVSGIVQDPSPFPLQYDPSSPAANAQGYVRTPNVNEVTEMTDLAAASESYDANASALGIEEQTAAKILNLGQGV